MIELTGPGRSVLPIYTLQDWRPDSLPECSNPTCKCEINNGDRYIVVPGSIKMLCFACARQLPAWQAAIEAQVRLEEQQKDARREKTRVVRQRRERSPKAGRTRPDPKTFRHGPPPPSPIPCPECKKPFTPYRKGLRGPQRWCSIGCASVGWRRERDSLKKPGVCPACRREFRLSRVQSGDPQVCCSRSCARYYERGLPNPNPPELRWTTAYSACRNCGKTESPHRGRGYCARCYMRARRQAERMTSRVEGKNSQFRIA